MCHGLLIALLFKTAVVPLCLKLASQAVSVYDNANYVYCIVQQIFVKLVSSFMQN